jgi:zinc transport system substrate-binding protein
MKKYLAAGLGLVITAIAVVLSYNTINEQQNADMQTNPTLTIVASFYPMYEFSKNVAGDNAHVLAFIPIGIEPHDWEPTTTDVLRLKDTDLFIYNGGGMEPFVNKLITTNEYTNVEFVETTAGINLNSSNVTNPHVWLDPILAIHQVNIIKNAMINSDPKNKQHYEDNASSYIAKLEELDSKIRTELSNCKKNVFVPFHDAYSYFASRYDLKVMPLSGMSPESEATAADIKQIIDFVKANQIKVIYTEELVDSKLAKTLANEAGAQMLTFSPLEGLTDAEYQNGVTYIQKMEQNLENLKVGLECQ